MNPQFLFNSALALIITGLILFFKGIYILGFGILGLAIGTSIIWLMSGFFGKFEYESTDRKTEEEKDEEGKGVLKPF